MWSMLKNIQWTKECHYSSAAIIKGHLLRKILFPKLCRLCKIFSQAVHHDGMLALMATSSQFLSRLTTSAKDFAQAEYVLCCRDSRALCLEAELAAAEGQQTDGRWLSFWWLWNELAQWRDEALCMRNGDDSASTQRSPRKLKGELTRKIPVKWYVDIKWLFGGKEKSDMFKARFFRQTKLPELHYKIFPKIQGLRFHLKASVKHSGKWQWDWTWTNSLGTSLPDVSRKKWQGTIIRDSSGA